jgi:hypothetical protein
MSCDIHISATAHGDLYFHCALGFATQQLAYTLDSLVRVSRRVVENHFVRIDEDTSAHTRVQSRQLKTAVLSTEARNHSEHDSLEYLVFLKGNLNPTDNVT